MPNKAILKKTMYIALVIFITLILIEVLRLVLLFSQIPRYKSYWDRNNQSSAGQNSIIYVALGDSTAQGIGATSPNKGYVGLIAKNIETKSGKPVQIINLSVSGAKLSDCLRDQIPKLTKYKADFVTIEIGANDMASFDEVNFRKDMDKLMSELPKNTVISDLPYFGGGRRKSLEKNVISASNIIKELTNSHSLRLAPLHQVTKTKDNIFTVSADFFHPSNRGYKNWKEAFEEGLNL